MNADHLSKEAERLRNDPIFIKALADIRADALNELVRTHADDTNNIIRLQQVAVLTEEIRATLARYIMAADAQEDAGSFA